MDISEARRSTICILQLLYTRYCRARAFCVLAVCLHIRLAIALCTMSELDGDTTENNISKEELIEDPSSLVQDRAEATISAASGDNDNCNDLPVVMDTPPITEGDAHLEQENATQDLREESDSKSADDNAVAKAECKPIANSDILQGNEDSRSSIQSVTSSRSIDPILKQGSL